MEILPLDQQKKAVLYAPKDLLWKIAEEEDAWLKLLGILPDEYYNQFLAKLRLLGVAEPQQMKNMAKVYVQNKVRLDHLQEAVTAAWNPGDLEDSTSWLKENGFLDRPLNPINVHAELSAHDLEAVIAEAAAVPRATRLRLARSAKGIRPKIGNPPDGASPEAIRCWNVVLRDPKRRKTIMAPRGVEDQWALAHKFWLRECASQNVPAYKSPAGGSSSSMHANNSLKRSFHEMHNSLCYDGYTMSRPTSRLFKRLYDQLTTDGYDMGKWNPVRPKTPKGI